jgi:hypothetical protein
VFEVFEASPRCEDVLAAKSALQWDFPGAAVAIPPRTFLDKGFRQSLCQFLEQASTESVNEFSAHSNKAGMSIVENRDTKDPGIITSLLMAILDANGRRLAPVMLRKRVRDDVLWNKSALPWRRLPFWLITRVAIQRHLQRHLSNNDTASDVARVEYKTFICLLLSNLLDDVRSSTTADRLSHLKTKLCRRLAKIDAEMENASELAMTSHKFYKTHLQARFEKTAALVDGSLQTRWGKFKESSTRQILPLPRRAEPDALTLSFQYGSLVHLRSLVTRFRNSKFTSTTSDQHTKHRKEEPRSSDILEPYFKLAETESQLQQKCALLGELWASEPVLDIAVDIRRYIGNVGDLYAFSVEQKVCHSHPKTRPPPPKLVLPPQNSSSPPHPIPLTDRCLEHYVVDSDGAVDAAGFGDLRAIPTYARIPPVFHPRNPRRPPCPQLDRHAARPENPGLSEAAHRNERVLEDGIRFPA